MHQSSCPQSSVSPDAPVAVSSVLPADSMGKSFPQNDVLMKVITMASSNNYYASGLIVGQLVDIPRFPQVFTLLSSNLLKSWNNKQLLKEAVQDFVETVAASNPLARIFIGSIILCPGMKQQTLDWATRKKITKLSKKGFAVEYINIHKLFLNEGSSFKAIVHWYALENRHIAKHIEKHYTCNKCGHSTYQKRLLKWHQVVHQQKYKYKCGICLFKSKYKWSLDCHWKTHK